MPLKFLREVEILFSRISKRILLETVWKDKWVTCRGSRRTTFSLRDDAEYRTIGKVFHVLRNFWPKSNNSLREALFLTIILQTIPSSKCTSTRLGGHSYKKKTFLMFICTHFPNENIDIICLKLRTYFIRAFKIYTYISYSSTFPNQHNLLNVAWVWIICSRTVSITAVFAVF